MQMASTWLETRVGEYPGLDQNHLDSPLDQNNQLGGGHELDSVDPMLLSFEEAFRRSNYEPPKAEVSGVILEQRPDGSWRPSRSNSPIASRSPSPPPRPGRSPSPPPPFTAQPRPTHLSFTDLEPSRVPGGGGTLSALNSAAGRVALEKRSQSPSRYSDQSGDRSVSPIRRVDRSADEAI